ncbi:hypothetical protein [uncultured Parasutterella sp.]|nr:hypothetical protein [uncultured Parasutterella sp.]
MEAKWSKNFISKCYVADTAFGWEHGETLSVVKDYLNDASSEVLEEIDRCSYYAWDVSGWGTIEEVLPFQVDPSYLVIHKANITNWEDYYKYRLTMIRLGGEIV